MGFLIDLREKYETEEMCKDYEIVWDDIPTNANEDSLGPYTCPVNHFGYSILVP